ncbi:MAG TPA: hypothetical protein PLM75_01835 [bacterium]|nr:hypothetical protein [bacterium]
MKKINNDYKSLVNVWKLKDQAYKEVAGLSLINALKKRLNDAIDTTATYDFKLTNIYKNK